MQASDIAVVSFCGAFAILSLITLKLALKPKQSETNLLASSRHQDELTCTQLINFLLLRFTLAEVLAVRQAHYKLNWMFAFAMFTTVATLAPGWQYFAWLVGTILGMLGFITIDMHIVHRENSQAIDLGERRRVQWRRPLLYGSYVLAACIAFGFVAYTFYYTFVQFRVFGIALGIMVAADQVARIALIILIGSATTKYGPMLALMRSYQEYQKQPEEVKAPEGCPASSPTKKQKAFPSPSRVPKASVQPDPDSMIAQSKIAGPFQLDSLVNFLEVSQRKRISKARLPPMHPPAAVPNSNIKQEYDMEVVECSKFNTPIKSIGRRDSNVLMSDIAKGLDDRAEERLDAFELASKELNSRSRSRVDNNKPKDVNTNEELKELDTVNHKYGSRSRAESNRGEGSQIKSHRNESDCQEVNTVEHQSKSKLSRKRPLDSPRDIIPKCHNNDDSLSEEDTKRRMWMEPSSHKRSIEHIDQEEVEEDDLPNKQRDRFEIRQNTGEFQEEQAPTRDRASTLDPLSVEVRSNREDPLGHKVSILEIREEGIEELEEVDLNSPVKRKTMSPQKIKQLAVGQAKQKRKKLKKRDIKELMKYNSGSPYLQYLPNMLKGEIEAYPKRSLRQIITKENTEDYATVKRGRSVRRGTNPQPRLGIDANNQNSYPVDDIVEDF